MSNEAVTASKSVFWGDDKSIEDNLEETLDAEEPEDFGHTHDYAGEDDNRRQLYLMCEMVRILRRVEAALLSVESIIQD